MFEGKTYQEAVDIIAKETADVVLALLDDGVGMTDFMELIEGGQAWNAAVKIPGIDKKTLFSHVVVALGKIGVNTALPLPTGTIPA